MIAIVLLLDYSIPFVRSQYMITTQYDRSNPFICTCNVFDLRRGYNKNSKIIIKNNKQTPIANFKPYWYFIFCPITLSLFNRGLFIIFYCQN